MVLLPILYSPVTHGQDEMHLIARVRMDGLANAIGCCTHAVAHQDRGDQATPSAKPFVRIAVRRTVHLLSLTFEAVSDIPI